MLAVYERVVGDYRHRAPATVPVTA